MILYACSTNPGKIAEFTLAAQESGRKDLVITRLPELQTIPTPEENGATFEENATIKALYYGQFTPELVFADDSGLEVDALQGAPGIHSARYAGPGASDNANNDLLLQNLQDKTDRTARFVCVITLAKGDRVLGTYRGQVVGRILSAPKGVGGFGYDPLFFYPPLQRSFGELTASEKWSVSHRGEACRKLLRTLPNFAP